MLLLSCSFLLYNQLLYIIKNVSVSYIVSEVTAFCLFTVVNNQHTSRWNSLLPWLAQILMFYFNLSPCRSNHTEGLKGPHWGPQKRSPLSIPCSISPSSFTNVKALKCNLVNAFFTEWSMNVLKTTDWTFWLISCGKLLLCYRRSLRQYHLVRMCRVRVRRCRCCWGRVALLTGYTGSHLPVILSAWHLHLYGSLFAPVVDLLDVTSSLRGTKLWHVTLLCLCVYVLLQCMFFSFRFPLFSLFFFFLPLISSSFLPVLPTLPAV